MKSAPASVLPAGPRVGAALALACLLAVASLPARAQESSESAPRAAARSADTAATAAVQRAEQQRLERERSIPIGAAGDATTPAAGEQQRRERSPALRVLDGLIRLGVVLGLLYATLWAIRRFRREPLASWGRESGGTIRLLETARLGPDRTLHLVAVGSRVLLLGSGPQGITFLTEFSEAELPEVWASGGFAGQLDDADAGYDEDGAAGARWSRDSAEPEGGARRALSRALETLRTASRPERGRDE